MIAWYVAYGAIAIVDGAFCWELASQNRFMEAACVLLMGAGAIWVSAANVFYEELPPPESFRE